VAKSTRIILSILGAVLFLCCVTGLGFTLLGSRLATQAIVSDPTRVAGIRDQIVSYQLPPGYAEMFASDILGMKVVAIGPRDTHADLLIIMLMQLPAAMSVNQADLRRQMETALAQQTGFGTADLSVVGTEQAEILGQEVTLTVREGRAGDGQTLRQVSGLFEGPNGLVFLFATGAAETWNRPLLDQFLASMQPVGAAHSPDE
jgi:hypothetical protein